MTRQFHDWQTAGGADDVMDLADIARLVEAHPALRPKLPEDMVRAIGG